MQIIIVLLCDAGSGVDEQQSRLLISRLLLAWEVLESKKDMIARSELISIWSSTELMGEYRYDRCKNKYAVDMGDSNSDRMELRHFVQQLTFFEAAVAHG
ncbi:hypothetical protein LOAG_15419 [Loa loa]|uniref:Uncharacterized protein n=1 Tax=Loa loa TaxID=7209 RepID=A0A1S0TFS4_LOALO|nr:hypothetical protein LOAG_15419 [Loa loa]EFO13111.1 hypothetical protein LOAG_15419 [Loa loa]